MTGTVVCFTVTRNSDRTYNITTKGNYRILSKTGVSERRLFDEMEELSIHLNDMDVAVLFELG